MKVVFARNQINGKLIKPEGSHQIAPAQSKYKGHICPLSIANPCMNNQLLRGQEQKSGRHREFNSRPQLGITSTSRYTNSR